MRQPIDPCTKKPCIRKSLPLTYEANARGCKLKRPLFLNNGRTSGKQQLDYPLIVDADFVSVVPHTAVPSLLESHIFIRMAFIDVSFVVVQLLYFLNIEKRRVNIHDNEERSHRDPSAQT